MMNLMSFDTPPLGRQECITTATNTIKAKEAAASSSSPCFHGSHLDLSLGISLSHGDGGGDAGARAGSYGSGGSGDDAGCMGSGAILTVATASELSVGHARNHNMLSGSWTAAFMPSPTGFMHPWSLAARQQKAAAEHDRSIARPPPATTYMPSAAPTAPVSLPAAVGWPPVHTSRRNLVTAAMNVPKPDASAVKLDSPKHEDIPAADEEINVAAPRNMTAAGARPPPANMFAKVHTDGYLIGRKINIRAHRSYNSLRQVLCKMTHNFFHPTDYSGTNMGEEDCANSDEFIFLYEDFEGDRMLVGDVPWELFVASAKRLYIAKNPATRNKDHDETPKTQATQDATTDKY